MRSSTQNKTLLSVREMTVFAMLGALMFVSKIFMEWAPNVHFLGMLTMTYTIVYRWKALIPIYIYAFLQGAYAGFNTWWVPYLYLWTVLWAVTMLLPKRMPPWLCMVVYPAVCALHGFAFGTLYAPFQALAFNLSFNGMLMWIANGLYFDMIHGLGNLGAGMLILPVSKLMLKLEKKSVQGYKNVKTAS